MTFHDIRFPTSIAFHSTGGPERKTEIVVLGSGFEERNGVWGASRRRYDVGIGVRSLDDIHALVAFFEARLGRLYGFRFKDFADFKSCAPGACVSPLDQAIGTGDGAACAFPLVKTYASGPSAFVRAIAKPVAGTVRVALAGIEQHGGFAVDAATGLVAFAAPPPAGAAVAAGFEFDVPARFDTDSLSINLANFQAGEVPSIPIVEIRI
jgi:uncharacterized protein (TIGR02217 family)